MRLRYPLHKRAKLVCEDCGGTISYSSFKHSRRCWSCFNGLRALQERKKRRVDRWINGTAYVDQSGNTRYATEQVDFGMTVAAAWASLRRSWKGFRIAKAHGDFEKVRLYTYRIYYLRAILNIAQSEIY